MAGIKIFDEARRHEGTVHRLPPRLIPVDVRKIVGTVSATKAALLTDAFLPRTEGTRSRRYCSVLAAMQADVPLPPIDVCKLRGQYFVVDGHHRVAAARTLGYLYLDALVHEYLLPATSDGNRLHNERVYFERMTGLSDITVTETGQYRKLLSQIREHQFFLGESGQEVGLKGAAQEWLDYVYRPIAERLTAGGVSGHFPGRSEADLYVYLCDYKWVRSQNKGMDIGFPKALADFERLYPPMSGPATGLAGLRRALHALARPVIGATGKGHGEDALASGGQAEGHGATALPCPLCGEIMESGNVTACAACQREVQATSA